MKGPKQSKQDQKHGEQSNQQGKKKLFCRCCKRNNHEIQDCRGAVYSVCSPAFSSMDWISIGALIIAVAMPVALGFLATFISPGANTDWYRSLNKPPWTPPNWVFPLMWTILYILMGGASWLIWKEGGFKTQALPLGFYIAQLILNFLWTPLFFGLRYLHGETSPKNLINLLALRVLCFVSAAYFQGVTLAASINLYVWIRNPKQGRPTYQDISRPLKDTVSHRSDVEHITSQRRRRNPLTFPSSTIVDEKWASND